MQTNRTPSRWGSEPPLYCLKWTDDRQTHHYLETGAHMLQAVYSVLTPKLEGPGGMRRDLDFPGKGGRGKSRRVREGEKDRKETGWQGVSRLGEGERRGLNMTIVKCNVLQDQNPTHLFKKTYYSYPIPIPYPFCLWPLTLSHWAEVAEM